MSQVVDGTDAATGPTHTYDYDYRSRRIYRQDVGQTAAQATVATFAGGTSVAEFVRGTDPVPTHAVQGAPTVAYLRGSDRGGGVGGLLYSLRPTDGGTPAARSCNVFNGRGDVVAQLDTTGSITYSTTYQADGRRVAGTTTGVNKDRQRANTKEEDPTGILNEGMRYRDLETGVFLTRDPAGFVDGPNVYAYVRQNPWTSFDPEGLDTKILFGIVVYGSEPGRIADETDYRRARDFDGWIFPDFGAARARVTAVQEHPLELAKGWVKGLAGSAEPNRSGSKEEELGRSQGYYITVGTTLLSFGKTGNAGMRPPGPGLVTTNGLIISPAVGTPVAVAPPIFVNSDAGPPASQKDISEKSSQESEAAAKTTIKQNKAAGDAWEADIINNQLPATQTGIQPQITVKSSGPSGKRVRLDAVGTDGTGGVRLTDGKASPTAPHTPNQTVVYPELEVYGGTVVGKGKGDYPGGKVIPPTKVDIIRKPKP